MKKGEIIENIEVEKLVFGGKGFARLVSENPDLDGRVLFITGGAIPGSVVSIRILKKKKDFIEGQIVDVIKKSLLEKKHPTNKYGMSGGWKWINIPYEEQLKIKEQQVKESLYYIEKKYQPGILSPLSQPFPPREKGVTAASSLPSGENREGAFMGIKPSPTVDGYRNKVEFSFGKYLSKKYDIEEHFNVGFHKQGEFSKVEDFDGCPLIDDFQNKVYLEIKNYCKTLGLPVFDQMRHEGFFRHLMIRKTYFTNGMMLLFSFNPDYFETHPKLDRVEKLEKLRTFFNELALKYSEIKSIYFSHNVNKSDTCIGDLELVFGVPTITEELLGLKFNISPTSFFQTNSSGAEKLYSMVLDFAGIDTDPSQFSTSRRDEASTIPSPERGGLGRGIGDMTVLDLYGGTGTIGMIFAKHGAKKVVSVELVTSASQDGEKNAKLNGLDNIEFENAKVEDFLGKYLSEGKKADLLVIDPPRAGMHPDALPNILKFGTEQIIYVSCNPATLSRDLGYILENSDYQIDKIQAMDMFPHTHHIETVVSLKIKK